MSMAQKLTAIAENEPKVYEAGLREGQLQCQTKHCAQVVTGTGEARLRFSMPFMPDVLMVTGYYPTGYKINNVLAQVQMDLATFSFIGGVVSSYNTAGTLTSAPVKASSAAERFRLQDDGTAEIFNFPGINTSEKGIFQKGLPYVVTAAKYAEGTLADRVTAYVRSLTGTGTAVLRKEKINEAFTDEQWQALIADSDWTFTLN